MLISIREISLFRTGLRQRQNIVVLLGRHQPQSSSLLDNNIQFYYSKLDFISLSSIAYSLALLAVMR